MASARSLLAALPIAVAACAPWLSSPAPQPTPAALIDAIERGDTAGARALLDRGADPNARAPNDDTALMLAALYGDADLVRALLDRQADPRAQNPAGATALLWAADDRDKALALLDAGADPNAAARSGFTPLLVAAGLDGGEPIVKLLLDRGADPNHASQSRATPLILAGGADAGTVKLLLDRGADPRAQNGAGSSALHAAADKGLAESARILLDRGADPDVHDGQQGRTPLMWAAQMGAGDVVRMLLERGADPSPAEPFSGTTALMQAAASERGGDAGVQALLAAGADATPIDHEGVSAFAWALRRGAATAAGAIHARSPKSAPASPSPPRGDRIGASNTARQALARAIPLLERSGPAFRAASGDGCASCHHQSLPAMAIARAKDRGFPVDAAARAAEAKATMDTLRASRERYLQGSGFPDVVEPAFLLVGLAAGGYPRDEMTDAITRYLALHQARDGRFRAAMQRAPMDGSDTTFTALAIRALSIYAPLARAKETRARIARAGDFLASVDASTNEDLTFKALGLRWAGARTADVAPTLARLVASQREDGGFAQLPALGSDAYATGQAIVALAEAGEMPASDPVIGRAVRFLLADQRADGSWFVATRALPFQTFFESGFPHGRSQYISAAATAWAAMALASAGEFGAPP